MHLKLLLLTLLLTLLHESLGCNRRRTGTSSCTPVDCRWGDWTKWSTCRGTKQFRFRAAGNLASCGGAKCSGSAFGFQTCNPNCPAVDCAWGDWGAWTTCTNGEQSRSRTKLTTESCGGTSCSGLPDETQPCSHNICKRSAPVDCVWDEWGTWSNCDTTAQQQSRSRTKTTPESCGGACTGSDTEPRTCNWDDSKCTAASGNCQQLFLDECEGGNFVPSKCGGPSERRCCEINAPGTTLTHEDAEAQLTTNSISIRTSGSCSDRYKSGCTSLDQIKSRNVPELIRLKTASNCDIAVTGGTEYYHHSHGTFSHYNGYKIDIGLDTCINNYIQTTFTKGADRGTDASYDDSARSITYYKESNHWDILYQDIPCTTAINCVWDQWGTWSTCVNAEQSRTRNKLTADSCGGTPCSGLSAESQPCSHNICKRSTPVDCVWGEWGTWSNCDTKTQSKSRTKTTPESCGGACTGSDKEPRACTYDDSKCTEIEGNCRDVSIGCEDGIFMGGQCGGPAERKCCVPIVTADITKLNATGCSDATAKQDNINKGGIDASNELMDTDFDNVNKSKVCFDRVGEKYRIHPAVIGAIASRETRGGSILQTNPDTGTDGWGDKRDGRYNGYGLLQCDVYTSGLNCTQYAWNSCEHIEMLIGGHLMKKLLPCVMRNHPDWTPEQQLQGAVAAYNFGCKNVQSWDKLDEGTSHDDYSNDVIARAQQLISAYNW